MVMTAQPIFDCMEAVMRQGSGAAKRILMSPRGRLLTPVIAEELSNSERVVIAFGPQPNKAIVGRNAFAHEAGIHQDGFLKERTTYEIMDPVTVGVPESRLVLGKHSGRHAINQRCKYLGYDPTREELDYVYQRFTAIADRKKGVLDEEIKSIIEDRRAVAAAAD
jgi:2-isopropylmalate synthase